MPPTNEPLSSTGAPVSSAPVQSQDPSSSSHNPLLIGGAFVALVLAAAAGYYYVAGGAATMPKEPVVIGITGFNQQKEAHEAFKARMTELGYVEGRDVIYDETFVLPGPNMIEDHTRNLERLLDPALGVDLLWLSLEIQAKIAVDMTRERGLDIPIVFISRFHDPVEYGLVESYRSSGNNATGVASNLLDIVQKHLEFFKEINPDMKTLGVFTEGFWVPPLSARYFEEIERQAPQFGIAIKEYTTDVPPPQAEAAFHEIAATIEKGDIDALIHIAGHPYASQQVGELELATRLGIPHAAPFEDLPGGGHFSYSDIFGLSAAQSATMVDKILRGAKPSDIPIEYGAHSELWLVLDRAEAAGITFPESMRFKAAQIFETEDQIPRPEEDDHEEEPA
jgi:putative ABC transport system substrate-binding protein